MMLQSHPVWVRGLKHRLNITICIVRGSHPVWVRGLKQSMLNAPMWQEDVAPRVGAWIETCLVRVKV